MEVNLVLPSVGWVGVWKGTHFMGSDKINLPLEQGKCHGPQDSQRTTAGTCCVRDVRIVWGSLQGSMWLEMDPETGSIQVYGYSSRKGTKLEIYRRTEEECFIHVWVCTRHFLVSSNSLFNLLGWRAWICRDGFSFLKIKCECWVHLGLYYAPGFSLLTYKIGTTRTLNW